jgi:hypothetical protein
MGAYMLVYSRIETISSRTTWAIARSPARETSRKRDIFTLNCHDMVYSPAINEEKGNSCMVSLDFMPFHPAQNTFQTFPVRYGDRLHTNSTGRSVQYFGIASCISS